MFEPTKIIIGSLVVPTIDFGIAVAPMQPGSVVKLTGNYVGELLEFCGIGTVAATAIISIALEKELGDIDYNYQTGDSVSVAFLRSGQQFWCRLASNQVVAPGDFLCSSTTIGMVKKYDLEGVPSGHPNTLIAIAYENKVTDENPGIVHAMII